MPEYDNKSQPEPLIIAKFKFGTQEAYNEFHSLVKKYLYGGQRVFDGTQRKNEKQAWFPLKEKGSKYLYE